MTHPAIDFLRKLDPSPDARFNIEVYTDVPSGGSKPHPDPLAQQYRGKSLDDVEGLLPKLQEHNARGAGVFVAVNAFKGRRKKGKLTRVRGVHGDFDGVDPATLQDVQARLEPTLQVQTSEPGNWHLYWLLSDGEDLAADQAEGINRGLADLGADRAAVDITRLLRLPGFHHMKRGGDPGISRDAQDPQLNPEVRLVLSGPRHTAAELRAAFPQAAKRTRPTSSQLNDTTLKQSTLEESEVLLRNKDTITRVVQHFADSYPKIWLGEWETMKDAVTGQPAYPSQSEADFDLLKDLARRLSAEGVSGAELPIVVQSAFEGSGLAQREKWILRPDYRDQSIRKACAQVRHPPASAAVRGAKVDWSLKADLRNARFFADCNRGRLIYVQDKGKWLSWQDKKWRPCQKGEEVEAAKQISIDLVTEANSIAASDQDRGVKLVREAAEAHKEPRIAAMLKLARSEAGMSVTTEDLDANEELLGVGNGVVDLRTGQLIENRPDRLITRYCNADYLQGKPAPRWLKFLDEVFEGDHETIEAIQILLGLTLTGVTREEILIFAVGSGANGKSIFSNVVSSVLDGYTVTAPSTLLAARRADDHGPRSDLAMLAGARLVSVNELPGGMTLDETVAKQLAGREPITARFLHREFFTFSPSFTPWVRTNHRPIIKGADDGIWRRLYVIRFGRTFSDDEADPYLEKTLLKERMGVLNWMVEGAQRYLQSGLKQSPAMFRDVAQYRSASDVLGEFLEEKTAEGDQREVLQSDLYWSWQRWCESNGYQAGAKATFTERLLERGFTTRKSGANRYYVGLELKGK